MRSERERERERELDCVPVIRRHFILKVVEGFPTRYSLARFESGLIRTQRCTLYVSLAGEKQTMCLLSAVRTGVPDQGASSSERTRSQASWKFRNSKTSFIDCRGKIEKNVQLHCNRLTLKRLIGLHCLNSIAIG